MAKTRKRIRMTVEVSCPTWLTAAEARREVKSLINNQAFWGSHRYAPAPYFGYVEVDESNFRAAKVRPAK